MKLALLMLFTATARAFVGMKQPLRSRPSFSSSLSMAAAADAKVILVTGSSRGLGAAIALELGKHGQKVVVNYMSEGSTDSANTVVKQIQDAGGDAVAVMGDGACM
jgi:hypothetical protein